MDQENVSASLTVAVAAARVFAVLADPATHAAIDGTGWVQEAADRIGGTVPVGRGRRGGPGRPGARWRRPARPRTCAG